VHLRNFHEKNIVVWLGNFRTLRPPTKPSARVQCAVHRLYGPSFYRYTTEHQLASSTCITLCLPAPCIPLSIKQNEEHLKMQSSRTPRKSHEISTTIILRQLDVNGSSHKRWRTTSKALRPSQVAYELSASPGHPSVQPMSFTRSIPIRLYSSSPAAGRHGGLEREGKGRPGARSDRSPVLLIASLAANFKLGQFCSYPRLHAASRFKWPACLARPRPVAAPAGPPGPGRPLCGPHVSTAVAMQ